MSKNAAITVYNTLGRSNQQFVTREHKKVNMFVCGPTVYDYAHLGHAKVYVFFDFVAKYLRSQGYEVNYVVNITDIDDKIIVRANQEQKQWSDISSLYTQAYLADMQNLKVSAVNHYAPASEHIPEIVSQVERLVAKGYAYAIDDGIYFDLSKFAAYGKLSGRNELRKDDSISRVDENHDKRNWNDFCLWKYKKASEPFWDTRIGAGRPGWHIEDTAIAEKYLGQQYDLHGGGSDLMFPHHEAEIAQMEAISGNDPYVRYWLHVGFLQVNAEKMSKSGGNSLAIREALSQYDYKTIRLLLLSTHYRSPLNVTAQSFAAARNGLAKINDFLRRSDINKEDSAELERVNKVRHEVLNQLNSDFNTPAAIGKIFSFIREENSKTSTPGRYAKQFMAEMNELFEIMSEEDNPVILDDNIRQLISARDAARKAKDFKRADEIRTQLEALGITVRDEVGGTTSRHS